MTPPPPPAESADDGLEIRIPLPELIEKLSHPEPFGLEGPVEVIQTHVSAVFLVGNRAYKVKKPIQLWGFLDYGSVDMRKHWCEIEVEYNRRLASGVYLGVVPITRQADGSLQVNGDGEVVEHAVEMTRLPKGVTFLERLEAGTLDETDMREAAALLAEFHREYRLPLETAPGPAAIGSVIRQNFLSTREGIGDLFPEAAHKGLSHRIAERLFAARRLLRRRTDDGKMVNGHGDVRLEHVIRHDGTVMAIDCVEFSDLVRHVDGLNDLAFLSMDCAERGRWDFAALLEDAYVGEANEDPEVAKTLLPLYRSYRAHVRAKVDYQTSLAPEIDEAFCAEKELGARRYLALAWTFAREGSRQPLILLRGPSGAGKSVLASAIAPWLGAEVVRSDLVRKELAGLAPTDRLDAAGNEALYSSDMSAKTYAAVLERGLDAIRRGRAAILDATYLRRDARDAVRDAAAEIGAPFVIVDVLCDDDEIRDRLIEREAEGLDPSDAGVAVYEAQLAEANPIADEEQPHAVTWRSGDPPEIGVLDIIDGLERSGRA